MRASDSSGDHFTTDNMESATARWDYDPVRLEIYKNLFSSIAEEMGVVLRKSSYSPNIKERRDFSCALFDSRANMVAQAAHIPVHLGSMPLSVAEAVHSFSDFAPGDTVILNDPFRGGTHLPDITMVTPVFLQDDSDAAIRSNRPNGDIFAYVASRAHHADVGGMTPGSMPVASEIFQEGLVIPPVYLIRKGRLDQGIMHLILANVRTPVERAGDLWAQIAANQRGATRLSEMVQRYGAGEVSQYMRALLAYTERTTRRLLAGYPDGEYTFHDFLDDDGLSESPVEIAVKITISGETATVDFSGSALQQRGGINAVYAITLSAVYYVFRCLLGLDVPNNSGCLKPITVVAPEGSVVNATPPAAVAGGNVETSQRIVDVLLGALSRAEHAGGLKRIPAASQGSMNNMTIGGHDPEHDRPFAYYETIGGGMGARPVADGPSAVHSHMTNTLNTPSEALEYAYPIRVVRYEIRRGSGGSGRYRGGDGIRRDIQVLVDSQVTLLTERRRFSPYGLEGGDAGMQGDNLILRAEQEIKLPGKGSFRLQTGDILSIRTPGGGGYGASESSTRDLNQRAIR